MLTVQPPYSNMQIELLKLYSAGAPDELLPEIKELIARFLLAKSRDEAGKIWKEKGYDENTIQQWIRKQFSFVASTPLTPKGEPKEVTAC